MPSTNYSDEIFQEYIDVIWSLLEQYSELGYCFLLGDFNTRVGKDGGPRGCENPNNRGRVVLELLEFLNLCAINLQEVTSGPHYTYFSDHFNCYSTLDYCCVSLKMIPLVSDSNVVQFTPDNLSDHLPLSIQLLYPGNSVPDNARDKQDDPARGECHRVPLWHRLGIEDIQNKYTKGVERKLGGFEISNMEIEEACIGLGKVLMETSLEFLPSQSKSKKPKEKRNKPPDVIVSARKEMLEAFRTWDTQGRLDDIAKENYFELRKKYRKMLRYHKRDDIVFKQQSLAEAAECDQKLFWSKYKQNKSATSPSHDAFNVEGTIISDPEDILSMWASHFESLGTPSESSNFDKSFYVYVNNDSEVIAHKCNEVQSDLDYDVTFEEFKYACQSRLVGKLGAMMV